MQLTFYPFRVNRIRVFEVVKFSCCEFVFINFLVYYYVEILLCVV